MRPKGAHSHNLFNLTNELGLLYMGIRASYRRITPDEFADMHINPELAENFLD